MDYTAWYPSEIGLLEVTATEQYLKSVLFVEVENVTGEGRAIQADLPPLVTTCLHQLDDYFRGERRDFSLPLDPDGTGFQKAVWQQLLTIPYGQTVSYLDVARQMGQEKAVRAVGAANGQNPIVIIVPCHRVIGSNGQLTGYGGGLWRKAWLLNHEKKFTSPQIALF